MKRLRVNDLRTFFGCERELIDNPKQKAGGLLSVEPLGDRHGDVQIIARLRGAKGRGGQFLRQTLNRRLVKPLIEQVDRFEIAQQARGDRIIPARFARLDKKAVRHRKLAQIALLQSPIDEELARIDRAFLFAFEASLQSLEIGCRFGVFAGQIAAIPFGQRLLRLERFGLNPRKG